MAKKMSQQKLQTDVPGAARTEQETRLTLEPQNLDLASTRIQVLLGLAAILIVCLANYYPFLNLGFLSDKTPEVAHITEAVHGNWQPLICDWHDDLIGKSQPDNFGFLASLSFLVDFAVWHLHALGYHLTNIVSAFASAVLVVLISLEINGLTGNRMGSPTALWAGFLYALHPLHALIVPSLGTRECLFASLFYLGAVFFFLRFQLLRERQYLIGAALAQLLGLSIDETSLTLPLVLGMASLLIQPLDPNRPSNKSKGIALRLGEAMRATWAFWVISLLYLAVGKHDFISPLSGGIPIVKDLAALVLNVEPFANEYDPFLSTILLGLTSLIVGLGVFRTQRTSNWRAYVFLVLWAVTEIAAGLDKLHVHRLLAGNSLFLAAAAIAILLAQLGLPSGDSRNRKETRAWAALGCALLAALAICWSYSLQYCLAVTQGN